MRLILYVLLAQLVEHLTLNLSFGSVVFLRLLYYLYITFSNWQYTVMCGMQGAFFDSSLKGDNDIAFTNQRIKEKNAI